MDSIDGPDVEREQVVIPDPSSELIQSPELWFTVWSWLPEWVICKEPQCVFRASRDGYKYVGRYLWLCAAYLYHIIAVFEHFIASVIASLVLS